MNSLLLCLSKKHDIWTVIDADEEEWVRQWNWNYARGGQRPYKVYAKRNVGKKRTPILLHKALLMKWCPLPPEIIKYFRLVGDHINGNSLDNRRENLRWIPKSHDVINSQAARRRYREEGRVWLTTSLNGELRRTSNPKPTGVPVSRKRASRKSSEDSRHRVAAQVSQLQEQDNGTETTRATFS
jgi:hypothetical protein